MNRRHSLLVGLDRIISIIVVFPLTILHWRGSWQLQDVYITPTDNETSWWISYGVGTNVGLVAVLVQPCIADWLQQLTAVGSGAGSATSDSAAIEPHLGYRVLRVLVTRTHVYVHGWALMCYWRGLWGLLDHYLTTDWFNSAIVYVLSQLILIASRTVRTAAGVPLAMQPDTDSTLLQPELVFNTPYSRIVGFALDHLFTQHVVVFSTICVWRGIWNVLDAFVFPHRHFRSDVACLIAGFAVVLASFALERPTAAVSAALDRLPSCRLLFEDVLFVVLVWANLLLWRGASNLCTHFILPPRTEDRNRLGAWLTHVVGTVGLMAMRAFNNVGLHGIERDGIYEGGQGIYRIRFLVDLVDVRRGADGDSRTKDECPAEAHCMESDSLISAQSPVKLDAVSRRHNGLALDDDANLERCRQELRASAVVLTSSDDDNGGDSEDDKWSSYTEKKRLNRDRTPQVAVRGGSSRTLFAGSASGAT